MTAITAKTRRPFPFLALRSSGATGEIFGSAATGAGERSGVRGDVPPNGTSGTPAVRSTTLRGVRFTGTVFATFFAVVFLGADFFTGVAFFATLFLATAFLTGDFLATAFFATVFLATAVLATVFFATVFFAATFLVVAFFAVVFLAVAMVINFL